MWSCNFRHGVMWNVIETQNVTVMCNMAWCGMWCPVCGNVAIMQDVESYDAAM